MSTLENSLVWIIDDQPKLLSVVEELLKKENYQVEAMLTVADALGKLKKGERPKFVLLDRSLANGHVEESDDLVTLSKALDRVGQPRDAFIIVYTTVEELKWADWCKIMDSGATRIMNKESSEQMLRDITILTKELDELLDISGTLETPTPERDKILAALVGSNVGVTVIDRFNYCWYANSAQRRILGGPCTNGLCWHRFHGHPAVAGPCNGCTVQRVFRNGAATGQTLFLSRFLEGNTKWVHVQSLPIYRGRKTEGNKDDIIAVRELVTESTEEVVSSLSTRERMQHIAQGLVHLGLGRAFICKAEGGTAIKLIAQAERTDDQRVLEDTVKGEYRKPAGAIASLIAVPLTPQMLKTLLADSTCIPKKPDSIVLKSDCRDPLAVELKLTAPYVAVPVYDDEGISRLAVILVDFERLPAEIKEHAIKRFMVNDPHGWQTDYAAQVSAALKASEGDREERNRFDVVARARLSVYAALSLADATAALRKAFADLAPECRVSVRIKAADNSLVLYNDLKVGNLVTKAPGPISMTDKTALTVWAVEKGWPVWIDDYASHCEAPEKLGVPVGLADAGITASVCHIPLRAENSVYGCLSLYSPKGSRITWEKGYQKPLLALAEVVALVVREIGLSQQLENALGQRAVMTTMAVAVADDGQWRHWAVQRLGEAANLAARGRDLANKPSTKGSDFRAIFEQIVDVLQIVSVEDSSEAETSLGSLMKKLRSRYEEEGRVSLPEPDEMQGGVAAPEFAVRHVLQVIINNGITAIADKGAEGHVHLTANREADNVVFRVVNNGPPIAGNIRQRLFHEPVTTTGGRGVGLLVGRAIAMKHHGDLTIDDNSEEACFVLALPASKTEP